MTFVAPRLTIRQADLVSSAVWVALRGRKKRFLKLVRFLCANNYLRPPEGLPRINFTNRFDPDFDNATARARYGFAVSQLQLSVTKLQLPRPEIRTGENGTL
ncbi:hypothetical protein PR001_g1132 [Phytophthora rubi]|uniref:Uncharacterized protein n=1 Tax=Phytophthora rubi TaxID=129364 RepID=A0A6A3PE11_9STRA|nr:hypothetical protein PR001_g1132 [Phytophthora rubi]